MHCEACGTENTPGAKFCSECGATLALTCPSCSAPIAAGSKFCSECGAVQGGQAPLRAQPAREPIAERRLVSVLFADLVGFTSASEGRDPEDTRELLTRYFDTSRTIIERYGGTVEKFIGDAVMAVWGTPVATEDDAERAVRAALDLVAAVSALGDEAGAPLRARAGVLTGEAAVTLGAHDQGMVAGDLVNTASRIQARGGARNRCSSASRRGARPRLRSRTPMPAPSSSRARTSPSRSGGRFASSRDGRALSRGRAWRRRSSAATASCGRSRTASTRRPRRNGPISSRSPASAGSASRGSRGSSTSTSTAWSRASTGIAAAVSPTATASPTGRSPTWCGCAA